MTLDKSVLVKLIQTELEGQLKIAMASANAARSTATHSESKAENKYDTFGLEASYLAHGQSTRVEELKASLENLKAMPIRSFGEDDPIGMASLVGLEDAEGNLSHVFIAPSGGGLKFSVDGRVVVVVTPEAPLGASLMTKYLEDDIRLNSKTPDQKTIVSIE